MSGNRLVMSQDSKPYRSYEINAAMRDIYDIGEKLMLFPILLGTVAKQIHDNPDHLFDIKLTREETIEWGLLQNSLTPEVKSLFKTWRYFENKSGYEYTFEAIPIQIKVIKGDYECLKRLDTKFYKIDEFKLPNPFKSYWQIRSLIK